MSSGSGMTREPGRYGSRGGGWMARFGMVSMTVSCGIAWLRCPITVPRGAGRRDPAGGCSGDRPAGIGASRWRYRAGREVYGRCATHLSSDPVRYRTRPPGAPAALSTIRRVGAVAQARERPRACGARPHRGRWDTATATRRRGEVPRWRTRRKRRDRRRRPTSRPPTRIAAAHVGPPFSSGGTLSAGTLSDCGFVGQVGAGATARRSAGAELDRNGASGTAPADATSGAPAAVTLSASTATIALRRCVTDMRAPSSVRRQPAAPAVVGSRRASRARRRHTIPLVAV